MQNVIGGRYPGAVFPVNPGYEELLGLRCYPEIAALPTRGVIVTAPGRRCDFVSRFFAPGAGIPQEDPVTGSAHSMLTPYWAKRLGRTRLQARQLSPRGGALELDHRGERVLITGRVVPYLEGRIRVPQAEVAYGSAAL